MARRRPSTSPAMHSSGSPRAGRCAARIPTATSGGDVGGQTVAPGRTAAPGPAVDSISMGTIRVVDVTDVVAFDRIPPCADPRFDHRTCDYWEDADRGSKAARSSWLKPAAEPRAKQPAGRSQAPNPFLTDLQEREPGFNPFATERPANPFLTPGDDDAPAVDNPVAPKPAERPAAGGGAPRKRQLSRRGLGA